MPQGQGSKCLPLPAAEASLSGSATWPSQEIKPWGRRVKSHHQVPSECLRLESPPRGQLLPAGAWRGLGAPPAPRKGQGKLFLLTATHLHPMPVRMQHWTFYNGLARADVPAVGAPWVPEHRGAHGVGKERGSAPAARRDTNTWSASSCAYGVFAEARGDTALPARLDLASCLTPCYLKGHEGTMQLGLTARAVKRVSVANIKRVLPLTICLNALLNGGQHARTSPIWFGHMGRRLMGLKSCQLNQVTPISPLLPRRRWRVCARLFPVPAVQPTTEGKLMHTRDGDRTAIVTLGARGICRALTSAGKSILGGATAGKQTEAGVVSAPGGFPSLGWSTGLCLALQDPGSPWLSAVSLSDLAIRILQLFTSKNLILQFFRN